MFSYSNNLTNFWKNKFFFVTSKKSVKSDIPHFEKYEKNYLSLVTYRQKTILVLYTKYWFLTTKVMLTSHSRGRGRVRHVGGSRHGAGRGVGLGDGAAAAVGRGGRVLCKIYISPTAVFARCNCSLNIVYPVGIPSAVCTPLHFCFIKILCEYCIFGPSGLGPPFARPL